MMLFHLTHSALWGDEWVEYYFSQKSMRTGEMYDAIVTTFQPPLYNFIMHFWLKISQSIFWFRLFNVFIGLATGFFIYKTIQKLYTKKAAALSITVLAVCYQWIFCIQECSEYALMLMCLSASVYFYISCTQNFDYFLFAGFVLSSILAIYSQYGSIFVVLPLLAIYFFRTVFDAQVQKKRKVIIFGTYVFSLAVFAAPLYLFFLKEQLAHNGISNNPVAFSSDIIRDFPFVFGQIIGYLFDANTGGIWAAVLSVISVILLALCLMIVTDRNVSWVKKSIILTLLSCYVLHFVLVQMHIYAMVHQGQSAGFYTRYSYFYIPILSVSLPVIAGESKTIFARLASWKRYAAAILAVWMLVLSFVGVMKNWHKSYDDVFMKIWEENEGWKDYTYLFGNNYGFYYYVEKLDNYDESFLDNVFNTVDNNNLPPRFWAWRINMGGDGWQTTIDTARSLGYTVNVFNDSGYRGQLAYCALEETPEQ